MNDHTTSTAPLIMIIRHGEKPTDAADGIEETGKDSGKSLIVTGWQRAGALVRFFAPLAGEPAAGKLATPKTIFACGPHAPNSDPDDTSKREEQTASPLASLLGFKLDLRFGVDEEDKVAKAAIAAAGPVLICWEHKRIPKLAGLIASGQPATGPGVPATWPKERFDMVLVLRPDAAGSYRCEQVPQMLLPGDSAELFPV